MARRYGHDPSQLGAKLAPKIALLVSHAMTDHLRRSGDYRAQIGTQAAIKFFQTLERERNTHLRDLLGRYLKHEATAPEVEKLLRFMHGGSGELSQLLVHSAIGGAVATGIGSGIANLLAPANQAIMYADPAQILEPSTMAQLAAQQIVDEKYAEAIGRLSGLPETATRYLIESARAYPGIGELLELLRRKKLSPELTTLALRRSGVPDDYIGPLFTLVREHLSPADAALAVLRSVISEDAGRAIAHLSGIEPGDFDILVENTGEPPGLEQLLEAFRRKYITEEQLEHGIRQSRVRNEWIPTVKDLRFARASPSDALRGVVQGHLTNEQGKEIAEQGGLWPDDWKWLLETEGNPAAPMEMITLWRRGKASQAQVEQAIREGRTKNKYIPALINLKRAVPSLFQVLKLIEKGSVTEREGARLLHELGYESDVVTGLLHGATHGQVTKDKELAKSEILELLYDHAIDEARAKKLLEGLGYHAANVTLLLELTNLRRERAIEQASIAPIRSAFLHRHVTEQEASAKLDSLGLPHTQRDFALQRWAVDRAATTRTLTEAQIAKANERGLIDDASAEARLLDLGYTRADARILLELEKSRSHPAP